MLPYFLGKLKDATEGDATLLDKTLIFYGSPMANGNVHNHRNCPLIIVGGGNGANPGGIHVKAKDDTPMANVMLTMMHRLGLDDIQTFGDSTGDFSFASV
jgi:hypothetical protein